MEVVLIILMAAVSCLAGLIAYSVQQWLRSSPPPEDKIGRPANTQKSTRQENPEPHFYSHNIESIVLPAPIPSSRAAIYEHVPHETTCVESRYEEWRGEGADKYPPDWKFRALEVRQRDGGRCQVAGCPSIGLTHVHHLRAISKGGSHALSNLITLCEFHHALMPDHLEAIGENIESDRFGVRRGHMRRNEVRPGFHYVNPSIRRYRLADSQTIQDIVINQQFICPTCKTSTYECEPKQQDGWPAIDHTGKSVSLSLRLICQECGMAWYFPKMLAEEVGLVLARAFHKPSAIELIEYENRWIEDLLFLEATPCPRNDCLGHLIPKKNRNDHSIFLGCSMWYKTRCRGRP